MNGSPTKALFWRAIVAQVAGAQLFFWDAFVAGSARLEPVTDSYRVSVVLQGCRGGVGRGAGVGRGLGVGISRGVGVCAFAK